MSKDFLGAVTNRLQARGVTSRMDLEMHDAKTVEAGRAVRVLAAYTPMLGAPSVPDVVNWVSAKFGDLAKNVQVATRTVTVYPDNNTVTFILERKLMRQPLAASTSMIKAGVDQFMDTDGLVWEAVRSEGGPSFLVRKEDLSLEQMIQARKAALRSGGNTRKNTVMLASIDSIPSAGGGFASVQNGDMVEFYHAGSLHRGKVSSVGANGVQVKTSSDSFLIDPQAITSVVEKSAPAEKQEDDVMRRYYSLVYPGNPAMTETISPTSSLPVTDPRPLQVEPISASAAPRPTSRAAGYPTSAARIQVGATVGSKIKR